MESDQRPEGADSGAAATRKPAASEYTTAGLMALLAGHVEKAGGGSLAIGCKEDGSWIVSAEFGREAEDSPMAGGAAYGLCARLRAALESAAAQCGLIEPMSEEDSIAFEQTPERPRRVLILEAPDDEHPLTEGLTTGDVVQGSMARVAEADEVYVFRGGRAVAGKHRDRLLDDVEVTIQRRTA